ncbi:integrase [Inquilinus ginsengisoli]|uniref:Integrase n=1 Tax=Inquilinus ginsengisoli TaxID=363840 RepID=A0ABU1JJA9_9PROT|nr:tyrosine-type recombinase/integrase [Inquilinus ginsengisoli]MDR6288119.1 integrase [Inquilinus ginsengisoli]
MPITSDPNSSTSRRVPWNKGWLVGQKRPLRPKDVWSIRARLEIDGRERDLTLFNLAIDSKLRAGDLVSLKVEDVQVGGRTRERATIIQQKTARPVQFELTDSTRKSIQAWLARLGSDAGFLFPSPLRSQTHLSTRQYARIVHGWVSDAGPDSPAYGTHSMRRTKAAQIYRKTGSLRAVQLLLREYRPIPRHRG